MIQKKKRLFALLMVLLLSISLIPISSFAEAEAFSYEETTQEITTEVMPEIAELADDSAGSTELETAVQEVTATEPANITTDVDPEKTGSEVTYAAEEAAETVQGENGHEEGLTAASSETVERTEPDAEEASIDNSAGDQNEDNGTAGIPVSVVFHIAPEGAVLKVYTKDEQEEETVVDPEEDGSYQLVTGEYYYSVSAEGYISIEEERLSVIETDEPLEIDVNMEKEETQQGAEEEEEDRQEEATLAAALQKLAAPSELEWGKKEDGSALPGTAYFKANQPTQNRYYYEVFKVGKGSVYHVTHSFGVNMSGYYDLEGFIAENEPETGDYYFELTAKGDGQQYSDSDTVRSATWHYDKPSRQLGAVSNLVLNASTASWTNPADTEYIGGDFLDIQFSKTKDGQYVSAGWAYSYNGISNSSSIYEDCFERMGAGFYKVRVKLLSKDITKCTNSSWSAWSEPKDLSQLFSSMGRTIEDINANSGSKSASQIRQEVQALDQSDMKLAMMTDQNDTGIVKAMEELEQKVGGSGVEVKDSMKNSFAQSDVKVVGAALNTPEDETKQIKLVVDQPKNEDVIPTRFDSTVAVKFSMTLENAQQTSYLPVPVKVTLPVPAGINPDYLAILHYHEGGWTEEIHPYCFQKNGKYYASFLLTSFSDFAMTTQVLSGGFEDVRDSAQYYFQPVYWAVARGITSGTSPTTFSPNKTCTRGQIVTFLWKALKSPEPSSANNPFTDVKESDYFYQPVLWAKENKITSGTSATTFSPMNPCTRGQIMTFLWIALGRPEPASENNPFTDVSAGDYFYKPVLWAVEKGITAGTSATTFSPGKACTRAQAMTFLYKAMN